MPSSVHRVIRPLRPRDPAEPERESSSLELLTDLCYVVAVSQCATHLHHSLVEGHYLHGVVGFAMAFFAVFWAWLNFTWFASAYDNDDVLYRLLTILQIVGVLMLAAGVPRLFEGDTPWLAVTGYVVMRIGLVTQWLRAAWGDRQRRTTALRYGAGVSAVQVWWLGLLVVPHDWLLPWFVVGGIFELAIPGFAERAGDTPWHAGHVAGRYAEFFIIVLGELILSTTLAIQQSIDEGEAVWDLVRIAGGGVLIVFSLWWLYFCRDDAEVLSGRTNRQNMTWGFGHYAILASTAAVGAGLAARVDQAMPHSEASELGTAGGLCIAVAAAVVSIYLIHLRQHDPSWRLAALVGGCAVVVVAGMFTSVPELVAALACVLLVVAVSQPQRAAGGVAGRTAT